MQTEMRGKEKPEKYPLIDIFRLFCAFLVTLIHMGANENTPIAKLIIVCFSGQAVPFFFIVSGFFFARSLDGKQDKNAFVSEYSRKYIVYYAAWILLQNPQLLNDYLPLYRGRSPIYIAVVLARRVFLAGTAPFWYLLVLAETSFIVGHLLIYRKDKLLYILASIGFLLGYIYNTTIEGFAFDVIRRVTYIVFSWNCNFLMSGIPYFTIGVLFRRYIDKLHIGLPKTVLLYLLVCVASVCCYGKPKVLNLIPFSSFMAVALFLVGISAKGKWIKEKICKVSRECSTAIYCLHTFVMIYIMGDIIPWADSTLINFLVIIAVGALVLVLSERLRIKFIHRLITLK